jgi:hypothetical protein
VPSVQIQFHADPEEAVSLALELGRRHGLTAVVERFFPDYEAKVVGNGERPPSTLAGRQSEILRVALCRTEPDVTARSAHEFVTRNSECMYLSIGGRSDDGVRESALSGVTEHQETLRLWRRMAREAKSGMHKGATIRNPFTGDTVRAASHLHTPGAHELAAGGVRMLAAAGAAEYEFDDCAA